MNRSGHSRHKSHSQSVQCTRPSHCLHQRWRHNPIQLPDVTIATQRTLLRGHVNGTKIILKSMDPHSNLSWFLYVQGLIHAYLIVFISRVIRLNCFRKMWRISLPRILQNNVLQCLLKTAGVITNNGFPECIILYNALCTKLAGEIMHCKPCYNQNQNIFIQENQFEIGIYKMLVVLFWPQSVKQNSSHLSCKLRQKASSILGVSMPRDDT